ncbi:hypothetical protein ACSSS7_004075 [Eimeria intestinalis]
MGRAAQRHERLSCIKGKVKESHIEFVGGAATRRARICKLPTRRLACEPASFREYTDSGSALFTWHSPDALKQAGLDDVCTDEATVAGAAVESASSIKQNRSACGTMQFCSLPDPHPAGVRDPLFAESAALEASISGWVESDSAAPLREARTVGMEDPDELPIKGAAAPAQPCQQAMDESTCLQRSTLPPELPCEPVSLREAFNQTGGRVAVETDDEGFSPPAGLSISRPDSPCSPPLGIVPKSATKQKKETGSLQQTLSSLWNELEAAHRGGVEPVGSSREAPSSRGPELATLDFFLPPADTVEAGLADCYLNFFRPAAHASTSTTIEKAGAIWKREGLIEHIECGMSSSPRNPDGSPATSQRKNAWDLFSTAGGRGALEEQAEKGKEKVLSKNHSPEFRRPDQQSQTDAPQGATDSASVVSEMISRLKENMTATGTIAFSGPFNRFSRYVNRRSQGPSASSGECCLIANLHSASEGAVRRGLWHSRVVAVSRSAPSRIAIKSQEARVATPPSTPSEQSRGVFKCAVFSEIGSFAAAARAAAVVLIHSLSVEDGCPARPSFQASAVERQMRKGPAQCFIRVTPEDYPTVWSVYKPKFACGDPQAKIHSYASKEVYQNDIKGRQAMADAVYASCLARKQHSNLTTRGNTRCQSDRRDDLGQQVDTVWNTHGQAKFERAKLGLPITCLVDYAGFAVLVEPLLPLNPAPVNVLEELAADIRGRLPDFANQCESMGNLLACFDALDKVDRATYNKFKNIARFLNLADFPFARGASDFELPLPPAALWRSQVDHFCIFRNLHEMLPPKCAGGRVAPASLDPEA